MIFLFQPSIITFCHVLPVALLLLLFLAVTSLLIGTSLLTRTAAAQTRTQVALTVRVSESHLLNQVSQRLQ